MKIKENFNLKDLEDYGFERPDTEEFGEDIYIQESEYVYDCGHARRGQWYYILVSKDRKVCIYSTKPDGSGGKVLLPNVLIEMVKDDIFE